MRPSPDGLATGGLAGPARGPAYAARCARPRAGIDALHAAIPASGIGGHAVSGLRARRSADYYAAFVTAPADHTAEAVGHTAE